MNDSTLIRGLMQELPAPGEVFPLDRRERWLALAAVIFEWQYDESTTTAVSTDPAQPSAAGKESKAAVLSLPPDPPPRATEILQLAKPYVPAVVEVDDLAEQLEKQVADNGGFSSAPSSGDEKEEPDADDYPHGVCKQCGERPALSDRGRYARLCTVCKGDIQAPPQFNGAPLDPEHLVLERAKRGLTQQELADQAGVRVNIIKRCESPHMMATQGHPSAPSWQGIVAALNRIPELKPEVELGPLLTSAPERVCTACGRQSLPGPYNECLHCGIAGHWKEA